MSAVINHPARTSGVLGSVVVAVAYAAGADATTIATIGAAAGALPALVGWVIDQGGIRGVARAFWQGR